MTESFTALRKKMAVIDTLPVDSAEWEAAIDAACDDWSLLDKQQQMDIFIELYCSLSEAKQDEIFTFCEEMKRADKQKKMSESGL